MEKNTKQKPQKKKIDCKKYFLVIVCIVFVLLFLLCLNNNIYSKILDYFNLKNFYTSDKLSVHFIDVKQGDCSLIMYDNTNILIDTGEEIYSSDVVDYLNYCKVDKLDLVIISHPHSDHVGGLFNIIDKIKVDEVIIPKISEKAPKNEFDFINFKNNLDKNNVKLNLCSKNMNMNFDDITLENFITLEDVNDLNNCSICTRLIYKECSFLFTGDIEKKAEKKLIQNNIKSDLLKVPHHGSNSSSTIEFLDKIEPKICVISSGYKNTFGHPHDKVIERLRMYTNNIYRTDLLGNIVFECEGNKICYRNN